MDIHQFDDLPYCGKIAPTTPGIPPEIVDTPIGLNIPPHCACINIDYDLNLKYNQVRKFSASGAFFARGDCCEGNYGTRIGLEIPCPILDGPSSSSSAARKIRVGISYGSGAQAASASFMDVDAESCTIRPLSPDLRLNIPCPVINNDNKLKIGIAYGKGPGLASAKIIKADEKKCTIEGASANLSLNIPCPIIGRKNKPKIKVGIRYGSYGMEDSHSLAKIDPKGCNIEIFSPELRVALPCPLKQPSNLTRRQRRYMAANGGRIPFYRDYRLKYTSTSSSSSSASPYMEMDPAKCEYRPFLSDIQKTLTIPCPLRDNGSSTIKLLANIKYSSSGSSVSASLAHIDHKGCNVNFLSPTISLALPCPLKRPSVLSRRQLDYMAANGGRIPFYRDYRLKYTSTSSSSSSSSASPYMELDPSKCIYRHLIPDRTIKLELPCPINVIGSSSSSCSYKTVRIKANIRYKKDDSSSDDSSSEDAGSSISASIGRFYPKSCRFDVNEVIKLNLRMDYPPLGAFSIEDCHIVYRHFYAAHRIYTIDGSFPAEDGSWYLNVNHAALGSARLSRFAGINNSINTSIKLFRIKDCRIIDDYRGMPFIPVYA